MNKKESHEWKELLFHYEKYLSVVEFVVWQVQRIKLAKTAIRKSLY